MENGKKHHGPLHHLITIIGVILGIAVIIVGLIYAFFFDNGKTPYQPNNVSAEEMISDVVVDSCDDIKDTQKLNIAINAATLNQLFANASNQIKTSSNNYLETLYVDVKDNNYDFYIDTHLPIPIFQTRIIIFTTIDYNETDFIFHINSIKLGRFDCTGIISNINVINDNQIEQIFKSIGIDVKSDIANRTLTYNFYNMYRNLISKLTVDNSFFQAIMEEIKLQIDGVLSFSFDFKKYITNNDLIKDETNKLTNIAFEIYKDNILKLIKTKIIKPENAQCIFKFLLIGYKNLSQEEKEFITNIDLSSVGIIDNSKYQGSIVETLDLVKEIVEQIQNFDIYSIEPNKTYTIVSLDEYMFTKFLRSSTLLFINKVINSTKNFAYFVIDNIYTEITKNDIYLVVGININGLEIRVIMDLKTESISSSLSLTCNINKIYLGELEVSKTLFDEILSMISSNITSNEIISYNQLTSDFIIDLTIPFQKSELLNFLLSIGNLNIVLYGDRIESTGSINVNLTTSSI